MLRKLLAFLLLLILLAGALHLFRAPVLRSFAVFLIKEDTLQQADMMFVLSGAGYERGNEAAKIFAKGYVPKIACTGANPQIEFRVFGIDTLESEVTIANLRRLGIPDSVIIKIPEGTSTREESSVILNYCSKNNLRKIIIVTSRLHTRRVNKVFREKFEEANIQLIVHGTPARSFNEMQWWYNEDGLIAVNNEWMKTLYYWWNY